MAGVTLSNPTIGSQAGVAPWPIGYLWGMGVSKGMECPPHPTHTHTRLCHRRHIEALFPKAYFGGKREQMGHQDGPYGVHASWDTAAT